MSVTKIACQHLFNQFPDKKGQIFENFVFQELKKQISLSNVDCDLYYYRTTAGKEVDFVLESFDNRIVGIEVKTSTSVSPNSFKGLIDLKNNINNLFYRGFVLYMGNSIVPFTEKKYALPLTFIFRKILFNES